MVPQVGPVVLTLSVYIWRLVSYAMWRRVHWWIGIRVQVATSIGQHCSVSPFIYYVKEKMKWILVQALRLCTGLKAHRGSRGIALLFLDHGNRRGWDVSLTPLPLFTPGKDPVPFLLEAGLAPGPVWKGAEKLAPIGIRSPDCPACSQSLYRQSYPARICLWYSCHNWFTRTCKKLLSQTLLINCEE
jgi:hypothetical protein